MHRHTRAIRCVPIQPRPGCGDPLLEDCLLAICEWCAFFRDDLLDHIHAGHLEQEGEMRERLRAAGVPG